MPRTSALEGYPISGDCHPVRIAVPDQGRGSTKPAPSAREVLVRIRAAAVNRVDSDELLHPLLRRLITPRAAVPERLGMDFAGAIAAEFLPLHCLAKHDVVCDQLVERCAHDFTETLFGGVVRSGSHFDG